jgi:hypothetical protein
VGVTGLDGIEKVPVPTPLIAATWNVYVSPFVRPGIVQFGATVVVEDGHASVVVTDVVVSVAVTVNPMMALLPVLFGGVQASPAAPFSPEADTMVGDAGSEAPLPLEVNCTFSFGVVAPATTVIDVNNCVL